MMIDYLRQHLGARLFLSYLAIILVGLVVLGAASQLALRGSFDRHMVAMMDTGDAGVVSPMGPGMGMGLGRQGPAGSSSPLFLEFRAGFNDALLVAGLAALVVALMLSFFFSRGVTVPVRAMSLAAERIAAGRYDERVPVDGVDELSQLASRFNDMAGKLEEVETMRRRLIADVSHELRTPLTSIQGSMEGLIDGLLPGSEQTYQQIHAEAARLNRIVDDLQELSRVEAHAYDLQLASVDIAGVIETVMKRLGPQATAKGVTLSSGELQGLPKVLADENRLVQVLANLVGNAAEFTPEGGQVVIKAALHGSQVHVSVSDTGIGIAPEHLTHIFDRFYRVDKSRSRRAGSGSGIGLTIARSLIEAHGGSLWAQSAGPGQGSVFAFSLPVAK
jgi:signal transduction histidine kinase